MEHCPSSWPDPVLSVHTLSESGATVIPDRYVKPPSDRPSLGPAVDVNIPVVDLGGRGSEALDDPAIVEAISGACKKWGFFQVVNHGVSPSLMAKAREAWREFFHQPIDEKRQNSNAPNCIEGYGTRLGVDKGAILDWGDYYYLQIYPVSARNHGKWPANPVACSAVIEEYSGEVVKLCVFMMKLLAMGLGLEAGALLKAFGGEEGGAAMTMRANFYPKCPQPDLTLGLSSHSDPGGMTVLLPDDCVEGLQVLKGGEWVTVRPAPHAFIVNVGDQIQIISNATYKSVEHRVITNSARERISVAVFYNPKGDLQVGPAKELVTPNRPLLYRSVSFNDYKLGIVTKGIHGKSHIDTLKVI